MSQQCQLCQKLKQTGIQSRHHKGVAGKQWAKRAQRTVRLFKPNLHKTTIEGVQYLLCAKCIKRIKAEKVAAQKEASEVKTA